MKLKLMRLLAIAVPMACLGPQVFAAEVWRYGVSVRGVQSTADGGFIIYAPSGTDNACPESGSLFYVQPNQNGQTLAGVKSAMAVVLTAFTAGKTITLAYDAATPNCFVRTVLVLP